MPDNLSTVQEVLAFYTKAKRQSKPWHDQIRKRRRLYDMDHYSTRARAGEERYEDPTYTNIVDLAVAIMLANDLTFKSFGWKPSPTEQKESDQVEKLLAGLVQINSERSESFLPYDVLLNFVRDGMAVIYMVWDDEIARRSHTVVSVPSEDPDSPEVMQIPAYREPPLRVEALDPTKIFLVPGGPNRWLDIFYVQNRPLIDVEMEYNKTIAKYVGRSRYDKEQILGDQIDCWRMVETTDPASGEDKRAVEHATIYEETVLVDWTVEDRYDDLPFTIGMFKPVDRDDPKNWAHSIIDPLESTVSMIERSINRRQRQITVFSAMGPVAYVQPGRDVQMDPALGSIVKLSPEEKVAFPEWPGNPPDVDKQINFFRERAGQSGFSDVMFGSAQGMTGYGLSQLGDQNRIRLEQPVQHLQLLWSRWAKKALHLLGTFASGSVVRVYGRMRGKDFLEQVFTEGLDEYNVQCEIKPEFPNDQVRKHALATQARGVLSENTIMQRYYDIEQPEDERERRMIEQMENHPLMIERSVIKILREAAETDPDAALVLQRLLSQSQEQGGRPANDPNQPTAPEQPLGLMGPTGQPTPQEMGGTPPGDQSNPYLATQAIRDMSRIGPGVAQLFGGGQ